MYIENENTKEVQQTNVLITFHINIINDLQEPLMIATSTVNAYTLKRTSLY